MTTTPQWYIKGSIIGACNCYWGCPCSFNSPPTYGACQDDLLGVSVGLEKIEDLIEDLDQALGWSCSEPRARTKRFAGRPAAE